MRLKVGAVAVLLTVSVVAIGLVAGFAGWDSSFWWWSQPAPVAPVSFTMAVPAPIDDVTLEYHSDGSFLVVTSGLRNGCETFRDYDARYVNNVIQVLVENNSPFDPTRMCAEVYRSITTRIPLDEVLGLGPLVPCQTYAVSANSRLFKLPAVAEDQDCTAPVDEGGAALGTPLTVGYGQQVDVPGTGLSLLFRDVLEDSRCPANVNCIWGGRARIQVSVSLNGIHIAEMTLGIQGDAPTGMTVVNGYSIRLAGLEPHPSAGSGDSDKSDYVAAIVVDRVAAG